MKRPLIEPMPKWERNGIALIYVLLTGTLGYLIWSILK